MFVASTVQRCNVLTTIKLEDANISSHFNTNKKILTWAIVYPVFHTDNQIPERH